MPTSFFRSIAAVAAVGAGTLAFLGAPAAAQTCYPPTPGCVTTSSSVVGTTGPSLNLSATTVTRGQKITATVAGFEPGTTGILSIASVEQQIGSFTMPAAGTASSSITIPTNISLGAHTIFARGTALNGQPGSASRAVTVVTGTTGGGGGGGGTSTSGGGGSSLARTGVIWLLPATIIGAGLVLGGVALKRSSRRGRASNPA